MTKVTEVSGVPTIGMDSRDPDVTRVVSTGTEALLTVVDATGELTIHPRTAAFGDGEHGQLMVPGWRGLLAYKRGEGHVNPGPEHDWDPFCLGDAICKAIAEGRIPLHSEDDLPESYRIPDLRAACATTTALTLRDDPTLELASRLHRVYSNALDGLDDWVGLADMDRDAWRAVAASAQQLLGADFPPQP